MAQLGCKTRSFKSHCIECRSETERKTVVLVFWVVKLIWHPIRLLSVSSEAVCEPVGGRYEFCAELRQKTAWEHHDPVSQEISANRKASVLESVSRRSDGLGLVRI